MRSVGETRYAKHGDVSIAYQVMGSGDLDLVYVSGWLAHLEVDMEFPRYAAFAERLASFSKLVRFDKRGTGMSDREIGTPTWPDRVVVREHVSRADVSVDPVQHSVGSQFGSGRGSKGNR